MKYFALIVVNLMRRPRRSILTVLTIAVATLLFAMLAARKAATPTT